MISRVVSALKQLIIPRVKIIVETSRNIETEAKIILLVLNPFATLIVHPHCQILCQDST